MWVWAEEKQIIPKELKKMLLLSKDKYGCTAWHLAAGRGSLEALDALWCWAKEEKLNTAELLLAQTVDGYTLFQLAAENSHVEILNRLWIWAEEMQITPKVKENIVSSQRRKLLKRVAP